MNKKDFIVRAQSLSAQLSSISDKLHSENSSEKDRNKGLLELTVLEEKISVFHSELDMLHAREQLILRPITIQLNKVCKGAKARIYSSIPASEYI